MTALCAVFFSRTAERRPISMASIAIIILRLVTIRKIIGNAGSAAIRMFSNVRTVFSFVMMRRSFRCLISKRTRITLTIVVVLASVTSVVGSITRDSRILTTISQVVVRCFSCKASVGAIVPVWLSNSSNIMLLSLWTIRDANLSRRMTFSLFTSFIIHMIKRSNGLFCGDPVQSKTCCINCEEQYFLLASIKVVTWVRSAKHISSRKNDKYRMTFKIRHRESAIFKIIEKIYSIAVNLAGVDLNVVDKKMISFFGISATSSGNSWYYTCEKCILFWFSDHVSQYFDDISSRRLCPISARTWLTGCVILSVIPIFRLNNAPS